MSDQKRLLLAAVLMAAVLFISWQFMGKSGTSESSQEAPQGRLAGLEQQRDPGARAVGIEAIPPPGLEVHEVVQLVRRGQRDDIR